MGNDFLSVTNLAFSLEGKSLFHSLSFSVPKGAIVGVLGPNGSGKTTLLRLLSRYWRPNAGELCLEGRRFADYSATSFAGRVSYLPQNLPTGLPMSVEDFLLLGLYPALVGRRVVTTETERLEKLIGDFDLAPMRHQKVGNLSAGETRRVFLAAGLMNRPGLYLLDEPNTGLDWRHHEMIFQQLKRCHEEEQLTLVLSLHDVGLARRFCDLVLLLSPRGETLFGPVKEVLRQDILEKTYEVTFPLYYTGGL